MKNTSRQRTLAGETGASMIELLVATAILMIVSSVVMTGVSGLTRLNRTTSNRADMHAGVRNATSLLAQEIGQAGRITFPANVTLQGNVGPGNGLWVPLNTVAGMYVGEQVIVGTGLLQETVRILAMNGNQIQADFLSAHVATEPVSLQGGITAGVVPTTMLNGSTGTKLKIVGDIHGDGQLSYVEYTCNQPAGGVGQLYRVSLAYDAAVKPPPTTEQILLDNVRENVNPDGTITPCFTYQERTVGANTYVIGVAVTLTVQTQTVDPVTGLFQTEKKSLLNVSPRNVFSVWQLAALNEANRLQPIPPETVANLLPDPVGQVN